MKEIKDIIEKSKKGDVIVMDERHDMNYNLSEKIRKQNKDVDNKNIDLSFSDYIVMGYGCYICEEIVKKVTGEEMNDKQKEKMMRMFIEHHKKKRMKGK